MSDSPPPAAPTPPRKKRPWRSTLLVLTIVIAFGAVGATAFPNKSAAHPATTKPYVPTFPKRWDPRIAPLAAIASKNRGLKFLHPIYVEFMTTAKFDKLVTNNAPSAKQKARLKQESDILRSVGLLTDSDDLLSLNNQDNSAALLAFYSFETKRAYIRGTSLTPAVKVTMVHELTHALQDQHFDVSDTAKRVENTPSDSYMAFSALMEGDARRVEYRYLNSLPSAQRQQVIASDRSTLKQAVVAEAGTPSYLGAAGSAPYELGELAVTRIYNKGGNAAVNKVFEHPTTQAIQFIDPWLMSHAWTGPKVPAPSFGPGKKAEGVSQLGAFTLYLMLAQRVALPQALKAAEQWGNDSLVVRDSGVGACIRDSIVGQTATGTRILETALMQWADGSQGAASVTASGNSLTLQACDPGPLTYSEPDHTNDAYFVLVHRNALEADIEKHGKSLSQSLCFSNSDIATFSPSILLKFAQGQITPAQHAKLVQLASRCYN